MTFTWSQVRDVVDAVLDLPPEQRSMYLDRVCPQPMLRRYVDSLVLSYDQAGGFLQSPAPLVQDFWTAAAEPESWIGRRLGPYEIIAEIGHGGMGAVYRAIRADDQYQKQVAIKVVRGGLESGFALSRFRAERQILANLEHPNVARLLDGGTTQRGVPFLVMELVEGEPIDLYCDFRRLSIRERLLLFRTICSAVTYAHQNLVVHRDLKPGNILITKEGVPKLLDFGIAKIMSQESTTPEAEPSVALLRILTPEYASPEQITGAPVSTATDVYSLGVVLYLLLTGHRPYRVDPSRPEQMIRTVCNEEPAKPSAKIREGTGAAAGDTDVGRMNADTLAAARDSKPEKLRRQLAGDLDNIVLKALRKEPERRYVSVEQLSEDLRRHLAGLPVGARKETFGYTAQKFATRNRFAVTAVALLLLSLSAGLVMTLHEARIARAQQAKANRRFQDVRALANSLMFEVHDGVANLPGSTPVRKLIIERALKYLDGLNQDARGDRSLEMELAMAYDKIGDVQGQPMEANLGDPAAAIASYEKALALRESLAAEDPKDTRVQHDLVYSYIRLSDLLGYHGERIRGLTYARKEIPAAQRLLEQDRGNEQNRVLLAGCHVDQGFKEAMSGDRVQGLATLQQGAEMLDHWLSKHLADGSVRRMLAITYGRIGDIQRTDGKGDADSLISFRKAVFTLQPLLVQDPNNAEVRRVLAYDQRCVGELLDDLNQRPEALAQEKAALASLQKLAAADPANVLLQGDIGIIRSRIGRILTELGSPDEAVREEEQAIAAFAKSKDTDAPESYYGFRLLWTQLWLGEANMALLSSTKLDAGQRKKRCREAQSLFRQCVPRFESLRDKGPGYDAEGALKEIADDMLRCPVPDQ
jgi:non-specific serine/threonine protein kinase/serine/threonine-protein kinase